MALKKLCKKLLPVLFWLGIWQAACLLTGSSIILPAPIAVAAKLPQLLSDRGFLLACARSLCNVMLGCTAAMLLGTLLAVAAHRSSAVKQLLQLPMAAAKATPVAAFVLMAFFLFGSRWLSCFIAALLALPVFYANVLQGLNAVPAPQLEAARLYALEQKKRLRYLYLPAAVPYFLAACESAAGLCWKAGIAAEVIAIARGTLGEALYDAKLTIDTAAVFAITAVTVALSILCEKLWCAALRRICSKLL